MSGNADTILYGEHPSREKKKHRKLENGVIEYFYDNYAVYRLFIPAGVEHIISSVRIKGEAIAYTRNGKLHRSEKEGPAVIHANGAKEYYDHGHLHRIHGPAKKNKSTLEWFNSGRRHRDPVDGPAVESHSLKMYFSNGQLHRKNGPAVIRINGKNEYWLDGRRVKVQNQSAESF